ncbi:flagellar hook-length control protein FliK [Leisingera sp. S232]|uniref:flagellar hook-length control protein FliK n=1 Tax=Leisingera sp. S232 TaxID=3415132 RepID=UPI003C7C0C16
MMMNSILGVEPAAAGKVLSSPVGSQKKTSESNEFSDFMAAETERSTPAGEESETASESVAENAEDEVSEHPAQPSGLNENVTEEAVQVVEVAVSETTSDTALEIPEQAQVVAEETADSLAAQLAGSADVNEAARNKESVGSVKNEKVSRFDAQPVRGMQEPGSDLGNLPEKGVSPREGLPGEGVKQVLAAGNAASHAEGRVNEGSQTKPKNIGVSESRVLPSPEAAENGATETTKPSRGSGEGLVAAGQSAAAPKAQVAEAGSSREPKSFKTEGAGSTNTMSAAPNERAVEQIAARQPDGVARTASSSVLAAVQSLAAGHSANQEKSHRAELGAAGVEVSEDAAAEALVEKKSKPAGAGGQVVQTALPSQAAQQAATIFQPMLASGEALAETGPHTLSLGLTGEAPGLSQLLAEASIGTQAAHRPELPRMIASQIAEAFAAKGEQKVEVSLNPQELGQVKMRVVTSETGITMIIQAERPETSDLMRRHIHELAEEFRRMGYEDISFEFSGGQSGGDNADENADDGTGQSAGVVGSQSGDETAGTQATQNLRLGSAGVDMRV